MNGLEFDRKMREIITDVTPETILRSTAALVKLGFGAQQSFAICETIIKAKNRADR